LTLAAISEPRIRDINIRDERSAGFVALGFAKATGVPAIVICTSGSAATHYFPAVVEADQSATPLIVITSDRPPRLRGSGAPQTMDQVELYGNHVKSFVDLTPDTEARRIAAEMCDTATEGVPGAVHLNTPFDEPLLPDQALAPSHPEPQLAATRAKGTGWEGPTDVLSSVAHKRVMFVASGRQGREFGSALATRATGISAPVIADAQVSIESPQVIPHADLLVGAGAMKFASPELVVRLGSLPTSKAVWQWLETSGVEQILVNNSRLRDPLESASTIIEGDPTAFLVNNGVEGSQPTEFADTWRRMGVVAEGAVDSVLATLTFPNEPEIARTLSRVTPPGSALYMASSMPIRDLDTFGTGRGDIRPLANRGVNGIDGTISSAIGAALAGIPTSLLIGDVAALHDATAIAEAAALGVPLRIIVVNNDGGGIFSFLPQASSDLITESAYERHWGTPHGLSLADIATPMNVSTRRITTLDGYAAAVAAPIDAPELIELITNRSDNVALHNAIRAEVAAALRRGEDVQ